MLIYFIVCDPCRLGGPRTLGASERAWEAWNVRDPESGLGLSDGARGFPTPTGEEDEGSDPGEEVARTLGSECPFCRHRPRWLRQEKILFCYYCEAGLWNEKLEFVEALRIWNQRARKEKR